MLLTGGVHGDEPSGVETLLRWLETPIPSGAGLEFFVLPCVNPVDYDRGIRENGDDAEVIAGAAVFGAIDPDVPEDEPLSPGVYGVPTAWGTTSLAAYVRHFHAPHTMTFEAPGGWPLDDGVAAHRAGLLAVLEER